MATRETIALNEPHSPPEKAVKAFESVEKEIKSELIRLRHHWNKHEPRMFERVAGLSDHQLTAFEISKDLVEIRSGVTPYGTIIFGKIKIPEFSDAKGEGFIHVRIHDTPVKAENGEVTYEVKLHSINTEEGDLDADGHPTSWKAIHTRETPLEFFNE